jgi:glycosyltransferase involved in cell wall biosynthesis
MSTRERVVHLSTVHARDDVRIFHKECAGLAAAGFDVHLLVADGKGAEFRDNIRIHDIGFMQGRMRRMVVQPWRMWRLARDLGAAVYHFHDPELIPMALLLRTAGYRVIYDAHEDVPRAVLSKFWLKPWLRRLVAALFERLENFAARRFTAVVAATPHIASRFRRLNSRSIDINNYPLAHELSHEVPTTEEGRAVCYVGGIGIIRGAVEMVSALEKANATLILAGPFESDRTEAVLRALPGWRRVNYRGVVSRDEVRRIMATSRAGLVFFHPEPNHVDAQPNKIFEYMSAGLPVLASDFPLWRSLLVDSGAGRCANPLDSADIARCIEELLDDPSGARVMGQRGRDAVRHKYHWPHEERKLVGLYREVLA